MILLKNLRDKYIRYARFTQGKFHVRKTQELNKQNVFNVDIYWNVCFLKSNVNKDKIDQMVCQSFYYENILNAIKLTLSPPIPYLMSIKNEAMKNLISCSLSCEQDSNASRDIDYLFLQINFRTQAQIIMHINYTFISQRFSGISCINNIFVFFSSYKFSPYYWSYLISAFFLAYKVVLFSRKVEKNTTL